MPNEFDYLVEAYGEDPVALPRLEAIALDSDETFSVEGAFVDRTESNADAALEAIRRTYQRHGVRPQDLERMRTLLLDAAPHRNDVAAVLALVGPGLVPDLQAALDHTSPEVRRRAIATLGVLGRGALAIGKLADPDPAVRAAAIRLRPDGDAWVAELAQQLTKEPVAAQRIALIDALRGVPSAAAALAILSCGADPDGDVRAHAAWRLQSLPLPKLPHDLTALAAATLAWLQREPEPGIVANLLRHAPLLPHAPPALGTLVALLHDADPALRHLAAAALGRAADDQASHAATALRGLAAAADDRDQIAACSALAALRDRDAIAAFANALRTWQVQPGERGQLKRQLQALRAQARDLPPPTAPLVPARPRVLDRATLPPPELSERERRLLAELADPRTAAAAIAHEPRRDRRGFWVETLTQRLPVEPVTELRQIILRAADKLAQPGSVALLISALDDAEADVRWEAARLLRYRGGDAAAHALLQRLGRETEAKVRRMLLDRDALLHSAPEAAPALQALCRDPDPQVRAAAVRQLRWLRFAAEPHVVPHLDDPDPDVRAAAIATLEAVGSAAVLPRLRALLATPAERARHAALRKAVEWIEWRASHGRPSHWT